ncbi:aldo/keto reductase [Comamonas endophytica]|uniref:Aldo/keto reductase n=1 Tax=Comamonas endophytica TaxID=2949090 RepID=A0ABY6GE90_9BURK|nr:MULTISPECIES: aldo/keto reductase [unclassified Acidovorax]MCD2512182.1 aldo/keto reductase [Acidovorax sp. D4N7]UYG53223.1 aldo/keto reductase [Acidovorax sp. 5MLIR]
MDRAQFLRAALAASLGAGLQGAAGAASAGRMRKRRIPSTGEELPVVGCGTWVGFGHAPGTAEYARLPAVVEALFDAGGSVLDSSPMYGLAERTTGEILSKSSRRGQAFLATKVWTTGREAGIRQMQESMALLGTQKLDLMQVHNLVDWQTHLQTLRGWKSEGRVRYVGITHYTQSAFREVEAVMRREPLDFLQINYALDDQGAAERLLPLAADKGIAVLVNQPFGGGDLLRQLRDRPLPAWAREIECGSWAQVLLKFVLSQPAVTCVIPGTSRAQHMADNAGAGQGVIPDAAFWRQRSLGL